MAQEQFAGPDHYTDFDPEKFVRDLKIQKEMEAEKTAGTKREDEADAAGIDGTGGKTDGANKS